jgi:thioredoxin-dependent peroxiredoxin
MVEVGDAAPEFCLPGASNQETCLESYLGKWLVLYFYPKDNTSGCTREAVDFTVAQPELHELSAEVVGISRDSPASHEKFAEKNGLKVLLLSDQEPHNPQ